MANDLRTLKPLTATERKKVARPEKISQTALAKFDGCPRSAWLYWKYKGGSQSAAMVRGEIFHQFVEESVEWLKGEDDQGKVRQMPPEVAKANVMHLIRERKDVHLPEYEQHALRGMAWNWAEATVIDPDEILSLEQMIELEVGDWTIRGKLDYAEIGPLGALVRDFKTSIYRPSQDEVESGAKSFQGKFYALLLLFGIPEGEDLPYGTGLNECRVELVYPRFKNDTTGELLGREVTRTRDELADFRHTLEGHLEKISDGLETGNWPAQTGAHCNECPCRPECPLPDRVHPVPYVETEEDAMANALAWHLGSRELEPLKAGVKGYCERTGLESLPYDTDYELAFVPDIRRVVDWESAGDGPVAREHITTQNGLKFMKRRRKDRNGN